MKDRDKQLHPTVSVGCNFLPLSTIPASDTQIVIYRDVYIRSTLPNRSTSNGSASCHNIVAPPRNNSPYWFSAMLISNWPPGGHIGFFGFRTLTLVWLWISTPKLSGTILIYMGRSLLIFKEVTFKMAAWWPYWIFLFPESNFSLALIINSKLQWHNTYVYG